MNPHHVSKRGDFATDLFIGLEIRPEVTAQVERADRLLLFLDFDGTLAPIVEEPGIGGPARSPRQVLIGLAAIETITIAIVSGRALGDVRDEREFRP